MTEVKYINKKLFKINYLQNNFASCTNPSSLINHRTSQAPIPHIFRNSNTEALKDMFM